MSVKTTRTFNIILRRAREQRGWSQEQVAEILGTSILSVSRWERGIVFPNPYYRQKLSSLFEQSPEALGLIPSEVVSAEPAATPSPAFLNVSSVVDEPVLPIPPYLILGTNLVGRETLLKQIKERLFNDESPVYAALQGLPGVGKTALAIALAHDPEIRAYFPDGVFWVSLGPTSQVFNISEYSNALLGLGSTDFVRLQDIEGQLPKLHRVLNAQHRLVILDDVWQVEDALAHQVYGPQSTYLLTTRMIDLAVRFAGKRVISVPELSEDESMTLLAKLVPGIVATESEQVRVLVRAVGGLPLGLVLMGKYLQVQEYSKQQRRIRLALEDLLQATKRLTLSLPQAIANQHFSLSTRTSLSLEASIGLSVANLNPAAQQMLRAISVFPSKPESFEEGAALDVSGGDAEALDSLVDVGLVESIGNGRYQLHQTIADYARLHMVPSRQVHSGEMSVADRKCKPRYLEEHQQAGD